MWTKKRIFFSILSFVMIFTMSFPIIHASDAEAGETEGEAIHDPDQVLTVADNGEVQYVEPEKPNMAVSRQSVTYGVVNFNTTGSGRVVEYTEDQTSRSGYINSVSGADAAFLGYNANGTKVKFLQAGVIGWVDAASVNVVPYNDDTVNVSYYAADSQGYFHHYITTNLSTWTGKIWVGYGPSYLKRGVGYFSYDGHYFYTTFESMINDYKNNVRTHAVNANNPYYNYFQYLPHRTKSNFTAAQLNQYLNAKTTTASVLRGEGASYIQYQNLYGVNALAVMGVSINESGWGTSTIAKTKLNVFGHKAYDSNVNQAATYASVNASIKEHALNYLSNGYLYSGDWRYNGGHLGDKAGGVNVKYASDPYWGEKAAAQAYALEAYYGNKNIDYGYYTIGIKTKQESVNVYKELSTSSQVLYATKAVKDYPFVILAEYTGPSVNGSTKWYKVQTDPTLTKNRSSVVLADGVYDFANNYGYIPASYVQVVNQGRYAEAPRTIAFSDSVITVKVKGTTKAKVKATPTNLTNVKLTYRTGNSKIASVDENGVVSGHAVGNTYLYATSENGLTTRVAIKVNPADIEKMYFSASKVTTAVAQTISNPLQIYPEEAIGQSILYTSSNTNVVKINNDKTFSAVGVGTAVITAKSADGRIARTTITVNSSSAVGVKFPIAIKELNIGQIRNVSAVTTPANVNMKITYRTGNRLIARVDEQGNVSAVGVGNTYLYATLDNGKETRIPIKVNPIEPTRLNFSESVIRMQVNESYASTLILYPTYASADKITYRTGNAAIASVDQSGVIHAHQKGNTYLYATSENGVTTRIAVDIK